jgi:hypothetical protein
MCREPVEIPGEGGERLYRAGIAIGRHRHEVLGGSAVDPGGMRVETLEGGYRTARRGGMTTNLALHGGLLYTGHTSGNRDADERQSPKRDTPRQRRVTTDDAAKSPDHANLRAPVHQCRCGLGSRRFAIIPARPLAPQFLA